MRGNKGKKFQIRNKVKEGRSFGNALKKKKRRSLGNGGSTCINYREKKENGNSILRWSTIFYRRFIRLCLITVRKILVV